MANELSIPDFEKFAASNPGQGSAREYEYLWTQISSRAASNILIFGVGLDSQMWIAANLGGRTEFIEHELEWIRMTSEKVPGISIHQVHYDTKRTQYKKLLHHPDLLLIDDLPAEVLTTPWDLIFVDSPQGGKSRKYPGRMKSIYTASELANKSEKQVDVILHDCNRKIERLYGDTYLGTDNLVQTIDTLRHYCL